MALGILDVHHLQLTVPADALDATRAFYQDVIGLARIPRPEHLSQGGAWFQHGSFQIHLSAGDPTAADNDRSKRHFCLQVANLQAAEAHLRAEGVAILPDTQPVPGWPRFYVRDPGGNRIEIAQEVPAAPVGPHP